MRSLFYMPILSILLFSCAGLEMTADECQAFDWEKKGREDGTSGKYRLSTYKNACSDSHFQVDSVHEALYLRGYSAQYCLPETAFKLGKDLKSFEIERCVKDRKRVLKYFSEGKKRGVLKKQMSDLDQSRRELLNTIRYGDLTKEEIASSKAQVLSYEKEIRELTREFSKLTENYVD